MTRPLLVLSLLASVVISQPVEPAQAKVQIDITVGGTLWGKGKITCSQGARLLRDRAYHSVTMKDCWGRYYIYRAWRNFRHYEIAVDSRNARVVDRHRLR
jgi:hypothetical protein